MKKVTVRYIVDDVDKAIHFYAELLNFNIEMHPAPTFAMLNKDNLRLVLSAPSEQGGGGKIMEDGTKPEPGGWNRFHLEVADIETRVAELKKQGAKFRNEIIEGIAGKQILLEDPAGNPIELFEYYENKYQ
jgi:catechol 2,3-dioxygenase-like lactoylglutathione lyase family enzyme